MTKTNLAEAVAAFAAKTVALPDSAMERTLPWQGRDTDVRWQFYRTYEELRALAAEIESERRGDTAITPAQAALAPYQVAYRELHGLLLGVGETELDRAPAEGEWPLRQVFAHIAEVEQFFLAITSYAIERWRSGDGRPLMLPEQEQARLQEQVIKPEGSVAEILARYAVLHQQVLTTLTPLGEADLAAPVGFWYDAPVRFHLFRFDAHLREHLIQIQKVVEAIRPRPGDAMRTLRLIYQALGAAEAAALGAPHVATGRQQAIAEAITARAGAIAAAAE